MTSLKHALLYGFFVWLVPFLVAMLISPLHADERPLFESIMPVVVTLCAVRFGHLYFGFVRTAFAREGILLGVVWLLISIAIDLILFSTGPMKMPLGEYMKDIGLTYLVIPTVTTGAGYLMQSRAAPRAA